MTSNFKKSAFISVFAALFLVAFTFGPKLPDPLPIGAKAPMTDVGLMDVSGTEVTLAETAGETGLLVVFSCNSCPWVKKWEDRYLTISRLARDSGVGMIALNSNEKDREDTESLEAMKVRAEEQGYDFRYVVDKDHKLADAYGASRTPDVFLFDSSMQLVYRGAIDDNARSAADVEEAYLTNAIQSLAAGSQIEPEVTKSIGCTIKRLR